MDEGIEPGSLKKKMEKNQKKLPPIHIPKKR